MEIFFFMDFFFFLNLEIGYINYTVYFQACTMSRSEWLTVLIGIVLVMMFIIGWIIACLQPRRERVIERTHLNHQGVGRDPYVLSLPDPE